MNLDKHLQRPVPPQTQDARDLLARLYREIGISAVAAALEIPMPKTSERPAAEAVQLPVRTDIAA
jgi:hypothetical protein